MKAQTYQYAAARKIKPARLNKLVMQKNTVLYFFQRAMLACNPSTLSNLADWAFLLRGCVCFN